MEVTEFVNMDPTEFVVAWTTAASLPDACARADLTEREARAYAAELRGLGVELKSLPDE